jgi:hypothetical protein
VARWEGVVEGRGSSPVLVFPASPCHCHIPLRNQGQRGGSKAPSPESGSAGRKQSALPGIRVSGAEAKRPPQRPEPLREAIYTAATVGGGGQVGTLGPWPVGGPEWGWDCGIPTGTAGLWKGRVGWPPLCHFALGSGFGSSPAPTCI